MSPVRRPRSPRRFRRAAALTGAVSLVVAPVVGSVVGSAAPAAAHGDRERIEQMQRTYSATATTPLVASGNVTHLRQVPGQAGISGCFMKTKPLFVTSGLDSVKVFNVGDPATPEERGSLQSAQFENEAMNCGERRTKNGVRRFALIGLDSYQAAPNPDDIAHVNVGGNELVIVDVTDEAHPRIRSRVPGTTSTHTVACVEEIDCRYAYSAGDDSSGTFSIFDLRRLSKPKELDSNPDKPGIQGFRSPTAGHKWNFDNAGYGTHTGWNGTAIFDVHKPRHPRLVTTTGAAGRGEDPKYAGWNDFIHHNSLRPRAKAFKKHAPASVENGNVLFVTEEDYEQTDCTRAGSFQTWKVTALSGRKDAIVPLDKVELADLGTFPVPQYAFCSSHWFDYHPKGIVAAGFYGGGLQLIDVRDPKHLKSYGHATWGASEVWDAYWVPKYDSFGRITHRRTDIVYTVDLVRGMDVYHVTLPGEAAFTAPVELGVGDGVPLVVVAGALLGAVVVRRRVTSG